MSCFHKTLLMCRMFSHVLTSGTLRVMKFVSHSERLNYLKIIILMLDIMNKTVKIILEIVKLVVTAILGYFGGNAIV